MSDFDKLMSRNKALVAPEAGSHADGLNLDHMRRCFLGGYTDPDAEASARIYKEVQDVPGLITTMEAYLADHNGMSLWVQLCKTTILPGQKSPWIIA